MNAHLHAKHFEQMIMLSTQLHFIFSWRINNAQHTLFLIPQPATLDVGTIQYEEYGCWNGDPGLRQPIDRLCSRKDCTAHVHGGGAQSFVTPQVTDTVITTALSQRAG